MQHCWPPAAFFSPRSTTDSNYYSLSAHGSIVRTATLSATTLDIGTVTPQIFRMAGTPSTMLPLGTTAPDFRLPDTNGKLVSLGELTGQPALLVMFICNHCPFVKHVRAELAKLGHDYAPKNVAIIAISSNDAVNYPDDSPAKMAEEARAAGYNFPVSTMSRKLWLTPIALLAHRIFPIRSKSSPRLSRPTR